MESSKKKKNGRDSAPSRLSSGVPTPVRSPSPASSVSKVYAAGESSFPEDFTLSSGPIRKSSTSSLRSTAARSSTTATTAATTATSTTSHPEVPSKEPDPADHAGADTPAARSYWFARKSTWRTAPRKPTPVCDYVSAESSNASSAGVAELEDTATGTLVLSPGRAPSIAGKKSHPRLTEEMRSRNASTTSLATKPPPLYTQPPAVSLPEEAPAREPTPEPQPVVETAPTQPAPPEEASGDATGNAQPAASSGWIGWWYGQPAPPAPAEQPPATEPDSCKAAESAEEALKATMAPEVQVTEEDEQKATTTQQEDPAPKPEDALIADTATPAQPRSWFSLWGSGYTPVPPTPTVSGEQAIEDSPVEMPATREQLVPTLVTVAEPEPVTAREVAQQVGATAAVPSSSGYGYGYGWGFWSSATATDASTEDAIPAAEGELAIAGTDSETNPQKAKVVKQLAAPPTPQKKTSTSTLRREEIESELSSEPKVLSASEVAIAETSAARKNVQKMLPENHVLPTFDSCYTHPDPPASILKRFTKILKPKQEPSKDHLFIAKPRRVKKAVAIGVHGFFPMRLVRTVLGEPTGTSVRFASHAAASIKRWAEQNGIEVEVEKIALEGEGKVADRVEMLWGLLQNWMDHVRNADFIMVAAHSQGVIVGMQLLARMVEEGCVDNARIGFTAMAGINLGPFGHLPTTLLTGSARELFEFQKQDSKVSQEYIRALRTVLAHHIRILYVGSIDDQLVPLESSTITNISHPYIYRAVFVDGRVHAPDFLSHLVGFAMKLRNLGVPDHGLIRELSSSLAGSLYGGQGHSSVYDEHAVYDLGVRHALETTDCTPDVPLRVSPFELAANSNPYFLPWSLRGMLEETVVRTRLSGECAELLDQFENWKPTSKTLKDVKFRLEGIRSKL